MYMYMQLYHHLTVYGFSLLGSLGNNDALRMLLSFRYSMTTRSRPANRISRCYHQGWSPQSRLTDPSTAVWWRSQSKRIKVSLHARRLDSRNLHPLCQEGWVVHTLCS